MLKLGKALLKLASLLITWFGGVKELLFWIFFEKITFAGGNTENVVQSFRTKNIVHNIRNDHIVNYETIYSSIPGSTSFWKIFERWPIYIDYVAEKSNTPVTLSKSDSVGTPIQVESKFNGVYVYIPRLSNIKSKVLDKILETKKLASAEPQLDESFRNEKLCWSCWTDLKRVMVYPTLDDYLLNIEPCWHKKFIDKFSWDSEAQSLLSEISKFIKSKSWYRDRGVPYRFGVLLYGEPGNGKSQFINYISQNFSLTQCCLYTSPNGSGFTLISSPHTGKSILAIEDYDSIFNGRENISKTLKGDFSQLLKLIDDFEGLVFITTNKLESIDPAIGIPVNGKSTRPGRIHRILKMGPPSEKVRTDIANNILYGYPDKIADVVREGEGESYAQFTDRCATLALELYWNLPV